MTLYNESMNSFLMDDYLLQKIKSYLVQDLFSTQFVSVCYSFKALAGVNRKFNRNFDLHGFMNCLLAHMNNISFFPCQLISSFVYQPVVHNLAMISYVVAWKSCQSCKKTLVNLLFSNNVQHPVYFYNFHLLFCQSHFQDLSNRDKFTHWDHVILSFVPMPNSTFTPKLEIFLNTSPDWC